MSVEPVFENVCEVQLNQSLNKSHLDKTLVCEDYVTPAEILIPDLWDRS